MLHRAYSLLNVKGVSETADNYVITGMASTPTPDRMGDIVEPMGAKFALPMPLLWQHDSHKPVGLVKFATPTEAGIPFVAELPKIKEAGTLRDRVEEAVQSVRYKLVAAVSIGFQSVAGAVTKLKNGGLHFTEWEWLELSLVTIPANSEATITSIKSLDDALRAATGHKQGESPPTAGVTATKQPASSGFFNVRSKGNPMKTIQELSASRTEKAARMGELLQLSKSEARSSTEAEATEFDALTDEVKSLDDEIRQMKFDAINSSQAKAVDGSSAYAASASRGPSIHVRSQDMDEKFPGQAFTRRVIAKCLANLEQDTAGNIAQARWGKTNPTLVRWIKSNEIAGGGSSSGEWGAELVQADTRYTGDFITMLQNRTVYDRLGLKTIPANVVVKGQDGNATGYWVGESKPIPVSKADFSTVSLAPLKVAALAVVSNELLRDSSPAAEMLVRDALVNASSQRIDQTFLSTTAASSLVSPAGILNGLVAILSAGVDAAALRTDIKALYRPFITALQVTGLVLVMHPSMAKALSLLVNALGQPEFPALGAGGGTLLGDPVVTGDNVDPSAIILLNPAEIYRIGDMGVQVSLSREAMIEQSAAPVGATDTPVAATQYMVSMFQTESTAIKVVRPINFAKRRSSAVAYISDADYDGIAS